MLNYPCIMYVFKSLYVHANTYLNSCKSLINVALLKGEQHVPRLTFFGSSSVPKLITSYCMVDEFVLQLVVLLNLFCKSKFLSMSRILLGVIFHNFRGFGYDVDSWRALSCSSSSIT